MRHPDFCPQARHLAYGHIRCLARSLNGPAKNILLTLNSKICPVKFSFRAVAKPRSDGSREKMRHPVASATRFSSSALLTAAALFFVSARAQAPATPPPATVAAKPAPGPLPEQVPINLFKVPEGFEITLWAKSPMLHNPTNMDIDAQGRIWITEGVNYRRHADRDTGGDRIRVG